MARKIWITELNRRYGVLHESSSYLDVATAVSFFTNQIFEPKTKEAASVFLYNSSKKINTAIMRFVE